jgi:hypothetical protein
MSAPIVSSFSPASTAKYASVPIEIIGSGFFGGGASFDVAKVTFGGLQVVVQPGGSDTNFTILTPVVNKSGSIDVIVTTNSGISSNGPKFVYTEFQEGQDRSIDYKTAQFWCYGCPFLEIKDRPRPPSGAVNPVSFDSVEPRYANTTKTHYWCGSPNVNFKQRYSQEMSLIGVGFCPFAVEKFQTLYSVSESF